MRCGERSANWRQRWLAAAFQSVIGWALLLGSPIQCVSAADDEAPFVAGFDRFARSGDIDSSAGGRLLVAELSCTACHASPDPLLAPKSGPRLEGAALRLQPDWIRHFLSAPSAAKPGTTMPDMLQGLTAAEKQRAIDALSAYLAQQRAPLPELQASGTDPVPHEFWRAGDLDRGRKRYHQLGCVACHAADDDYGEDGRPTAALSRNQEQLLEQFTPEEREALDIGRPAPPVRPVPLGATGTKYSAAGLAMFLIEPESVRPGGRMPNFRLSAAEAADLTAYLMRETVSLGDSDEPPRPDLAAEGRELFGRLGCAACHTAGDAARSRPATALASLNVDAQSSCIDGPADGQPVFRLDAAQRSALRAALASLDTNEQPTGVSHQAASAAPARLEFQLLQWNCYACHERGGRGGVGPQRQQYFHTAGHVDLGDEGRLPPPLSGVGNKLTPLWLQRVLTGAGDVRPYLQARMPKFSLAARQGLAELLARVDHPESVRGDTLTAKNELASAGRLLLDTGCVQCHPVRGESLPSVVGIDLATASQRLRPEWFYQFLLDPAQLKPRTRMPTFFPGGSSSLPELLGGDVQQQISALWSYLENIERLPLPQKIEEARSQAFELIPQDRPIVLRTFMQDVGTHAIAVGFPKQTHVAFDALGVRPAIAWQGRFLDAYGTWFDRFAPPAAPLGTEVVAFPSGSPLAELEDPRQAWPIATGPDAGFRFAGYRLDPDGVPTFLYQFAGWEVSDRFEPLDADTLERRLTLKVSGRAQPSRSLWFLAHAGQRLEQLSANTYKNEHDLRVRLAVEAAPSAVLASHGDQTQWRLPVGHDHRLTVEITYQW